MPWCHATRSDRHRRLPRRPVRRRHARVAPHREREPTICSRAAASALALAAFSIFATWFGAETIVGAAGSIYSDGLSGGSADPFGYGLCLDRARRRRRGAAVAAPVHDVRRPVPRALLAGRRAPRGAADGADVGAVGRGADPRVRPSRERVVGSRGRRSRSRAAAVFVIIYTVAGGLLADVVTDFVQSIAIVDRSRDPARRRRQRERRTRGAAVARSTRRASRCSRRLTRRRSRSSKRGPCPSAARCSPSRCCRESWAASRAATARNATLIGAAIYLDRRADPGDARPRRAPRSCRISRSPSSSSPCSRSSTCRRSCTCCSRAR